METATTLHLMWKRFKNGNTFECKRLCRQFVIIAVSGVWTLFVKVLVLNPIPLLVVSQSFSNFTLTWYGKMFLVSVTIFPANPSIPTANVLNAWLLSCEYNSFLNATGHVKWTLFYLHLQRSVFISEKFVFIWKFLKVVKVSENSLNCFVRFRKFSCEFYKSWKWRRMSI